MALGGVMLWKMPDPGWRRCLVILGALYLVFELACFILRWVFTDEGPVLNLKRALAGFLLNVVGVTVFFAVALVGFNCVNAPSGQVAVALYASFRTVTTMGPIGIYEPPACWQCGVLVMAEGAVGYLLTVLIIGALASFIAKERMPRR
jgi:hypothetical protein